MKTKLILALLICMFLIASCAQQSPPTITGQTGQPNQPPQANGNQGGQAQGGNTPPTETPPVQNQTQPPPSPAPTPSPSAKTYQVAIQNFAFDPFDLKINKGDMVVWTNEDSATHTVVSDSGSELASGTLATGQTYSHTFNSAGTFNYHCGVHQTMKARVEVS